MASRLSVSGTFPGTARDTNASTTKTIPAMPAHRLMALSFGRDALPALCEVYSHPGPGTFDATEGGLSGGFGRRGKGSNGPAVQGAGEGSRLPRRDRSLLRTAGRRRSPHPEAPGQAEGDRP